jgi:hypothetical protein
MELVAIESGRVIFLTQLTRPAGQLYMPEAAYKLQQKYLFAKSPALEELAKQVITFGVGKFSDIQIEELSIYPDGIIVSSKSNTNKLDAFIDDLFSWCKDEFGLSQSIIAKPTRWYESTLIVKSSRDLPMAARPANPIADVVNKTWKKMNPEGEFKFVAFRLDCDPGLFTGRRGPMAFSVERRVHIPFSENIFYSTSPFRTDDHLELLEAVERAAPE